MYSLTVRTLKLRIQGPGAGGHDSIRFERVQFIICAVLGRASVISKVADKAVLLLT